MNKMLLPFALALLSSAILSLPTSAESSSYNAPLDADLSSHLDSSEQAEPDSVPHIHSYTESMRIDPTCACGGVIVYRCGCGDIYEESLSATGTHSYSEWITEKSASCTRNGLKKRVCSVCGKIETRTVNRKGHEYVSSSVKSDYFTEGFTEHRCRICGYVYKDSYSPKKLLKKTSITGYSSTDNAARINWKKVNDASGYRIYMYDPAEKTWDKLADLKGSETTTYRTSSLRSGKAYRFKIKAYVKRDSDIEWSKTSAAYTAVTKPFSAKFKKPSVSKTSVRLKWKKQSCNGYEIYELKNGKWIRIKKISDSSVCEYKIKKLSSGSKHKYRIRAYIKDLHGNYLYGKYSDLITVKTKI